MRNGERFMVLINDDNIFVESVIPTAHWVKECSDPSDFSDEHFGGEQFGDTNLNDKRLPISQWHIAIGVSSGSNTFL